jgi:hypothetical protein
MCDYPMVCFVRGVLIINKYIQTFLFLCNYFPPDVHCILPIFVLLLWNVYREIMGKHMYEQAYLIFTHVSVVLTKYVIVILCEAEAQP